MEVFDYFGDVLTEGDSVYETWSFSPCFGTEFKVIKIEHGVVFYSRQDYPERYANTEPEKLVKKTNWFKFLHLQDLELIIDLINEELNATLNG